MTKDDIIKSSKKITDIGKKAIVGPSKFVFGPIMELLGRTTEATQMGVAESAKKIRGQESDILSGIISGLKGNEITGEELLKSFGVSDETFKKSKQITQQQVERMKPYLGSLAKYSTIDPMSAASTGTELAVDPFNIMLAGEAATRLISKTAKTPAIQKVLSTISGSKKSKRFDSASLKEELYDQFTRLEKISRNVPIEASPYVEARLLRGGIGGQMKVAIEDLEKSLEPFKVDVNDLRAYLRSARDLEIKKIKGYDFPTSINIPTAQQSILDLSNKYGDNIEKAANVITDFNRKALSRRVESGLISKETADALIKEHPRYIPTEVIEKLESGPDFISVSKLEPTKKAASIKKLKGRKELAETSDPIEASLRNYYSSELASQQNIVMNKLADLPNLDETLRGVIISVEKGKPLEKGYKPVRYFVNGEEKALAVPKELASSLKGLDSANIDIISNIMGIGSKLFKAGTTALNPFFIPKNFYRDVKTAIFRGLELPYLAKGAVASFSPLKKHKDIVKSFEKSRGAFGGTTGQLRQIGGLVEEINKFGKSKTEKFIKTVTNPLELIKSVGRGIRNIGERVENVPRVGMFRQELSKGKSLAEAAFSARDVTVDFAKSGKIMRIANMWIPFLNARIQGNVNVLKAFKSNPKRAFTSALFLEAVPEMATYIHNRDVWGEYQDDVPQYILDNNIVIATGLEKDEEGNTVPVGFKIPKPDVGKMVGNPIRSLMDSYYKEKPLEYKEIAMNIASSMSPIDFEREGKLSPSMAASSLIPPPIKAVVENIPDRGHSFFRDMPIERSYYEGIPSEKLMPPARFKEGEHSKTILELAKVLDTSPPKLENIIQNLFGQVGSTILSPDRTGEKFKKTFITKVGGARERKKIEELKEFEKKYTTEKILPIKKQAKELVEKHKNNTAEALLEALQTKNTDLISAVKTEYKKTKKNISDLNQMLTNVKPAIAADFLLETELKEIPEDKIVSKITDMITKQSINKTIAQALLLKVMLRRMKDKQ